MSDQTAPNFELSKLELSSFAPVKVAYSGDALRELSGESSEAGFFFSHTISIDEDSNSILLYLRLETRLRGKNTGGGTLATHEVVDRFVFRYSGDFWEDGLLIRHDDGREGIGLLPLVHGLLLSIAYATMRGQLPALFTNTPFRGYLLPIRAVEELMKIPMVPLQELGVYIVDVSLPEEE